MTAEKLLLDERETAELLDLDYRTLQAWRCRGTQDLPYVRVGRLVKYRRDDVIEFIERNLVRTEVE